VIRFFLLYARWDGTSIVHMLFKDIIPNSVLFLQIAGNNKNMSKRKQVKKDLNRFKEVPL